MPSIRSCALLLIILVLITICYTPVAHSQQDDSLSGMTFASENPKNLTNKLYMVFEVILPDKYAFNAPIECEVHVTLDIDIKNPPQSSIVELMIPYATTGIHCGRFLTMYELPPNATYDLVFDENLWHCIKIEMPVEPYAHISFAYTISGSSAMFRNYVSLDFLYITVRSNLRNLEKKITVKMLLPSTAVVVPPYPQKDPPYMQSQWNGSVWEVYGEFQGIYIVYESRYFVPVGILLTITLIFIVFAFVKYALRPIRGFLWVMTPRVMRWKVTRKLLGLWHWLLSLRGAAISLLVLVVASTTLALLIGRNPQYTVCVLSDAGTLTEIEATVRSMGFAVVSYHNISLWMSCELLRSSVFDVLLIGRVPVPRFMGLGALLDAFSEFLAAGRFIVVLRSYYPGLGSLIQASFPDNPRVIALDSLSELANLDLSVLGVPRVSLTTFRMCAATSAGLLVVAVAFAVVLELHVVERVSRSSFWWGIVFAFATAVALMLVLSSISYAVSKLYRTTLFSHGGGSGITAFSYISPKFGGGNTVRLIVGGLGFVAYLIEHRRRVVPIDATIIALTVTIIALLTINPHSIGLIISSQSLLYISGEQPFLVAERPVLTIDSAVSRIIMATADYIGLEREAVSRGICGWFFGCMLLPILFRGSKELKALVALLLPVFMLKGITRIGEMRLLTLAGSVPPALVMGAILVSGFVAVDFTLRVVKRKQQLRLLRTVVR